MNLVVTILIWKLVIESGLLSTSIFVAKVTLAIGQEEYLLLIVYEKIIHEHVISKI